MLRILFNKSINSNHKLIKRLMSSQIINTNDLDKSEDQKLSDKTHINSDKSVSEKQKAIEEELSQLTPQYMDRVWELNQSYDHKKDYNIITDPYFIAHKPYNSKLEAVLCWSSGFDIHSYKKGFKRWVQYREENQQKYVAKRMADLGPDLALANFVVVRGGRVRFMHYPKLWATHLDHFPNKYDPRYRLVGVDASHTKLRFEAIDNFQEMYSLEELNLSDNKLDDWSCDQLGRVFRNSKLSSLDLSNNVNITERGIETLHRIRSLKTLIIRGTSAAKFPFLDLLILSFNDLVVDCNIVYK